MASCAVLALLLVVSAAPLAVPTRFWAASVARSTAVFAMDFALSTMRSRASPISSCSRRVSGNASPTAAPTTIATAPTASGFCSIQYCSCDFA
jgi:hypothetical protein